MGELVIISKRILKQLLLAVGNYLCGLDLVDAELLATEEQRIEDRRSDRTTLSQNFFAGH